jgi:hypothetical protein
MVPTSGASAAAAPVPYEKLFRASCENEKPVVKEMLVKADVVETPKYAGWPEDGLIV